MLCSGVLVAQGELSGLDGYALHHLMPFGSGVAAGSPGLLGKLFAYSSPKFHLGRVLRIPASAGVSSILVLVLAAILWRRGRRAVAVLWLAGFAAATFVEGFGKLVITKPPLYALVDGISRVAGFSHSYPSGHAARSAVLAAVATAVWPRLWPLFAAWVAVVVFSAELDAIHTPSDIVGGLLLATAVIFGVLAVQARWEGALESRLRRSPFPPVRAAPQPER